MRPLARVTATWSCPTCWSPTPAARSLTSTWPTSATVTDLALFLAGLPADAPALAGCPGTTGSLPEAERAYLGAYEERSGQRLDPRRLAWHRASAELHQLAVLFSKDRIRLADVPRVRALVDSSVAAAR